MEFNKDFFVKTKGADYWTASLKVKLRLWGSAFRFNYKLTGAFNDPQYFVEAQILH